MRIRLFSVAFDLNKCVRFEELLSSSFRAWRAASRLYQYVLARTYVLMSPIRYSKDILAGLLALTIDIPNAIMNKCLCCCRSQFY